MAAPLLDTQWESDSDKGPFPMEHSDDDGFDHGHVIDITRGDIASTSVSYRDVSNDVDETHSEGRPSTSNQLPASRSPSPSGHAYSSRNTSRARRGDNHGRRHRSPLNSGLWISVELVVNLGQIIAAIVVLSFSRNEHPRAPLSAWIIGYTVGCFAALPHLYWRYKHRHSQGSDQESAQSNQRAVHNNSPESTSYSTISFTHPIDRRGSRGATVVSQLGQNFVISSPRLNALVDRFKMALDCFFAVWFVVGNVWIFGGHSSAADAPFLYWLCIAFLTFSCIGYAMPFILCATICCCLPCIISVLGLREDLTHTRGATSESINALPTYKFISKRKLDQESGEIDSGNHEGGILAAGTNKERIISPEDAVCCICLAKYAENDELRELPCTHFFHAHCVDKWLKINALCPLCKYVVGNGAGFFSVLSSIHQNRNPRLGSTADSATNAV
ncbi:E3 ubiquitin-protein ligase [Apostasia shenzhenica]|uniref:E3 ubiquitin-protein ligase n=1 Tax=Apostasia shenzhenica TaxID=1088818 RepID=A0A2I0ANU6_9ASPA|nr:E3 ubiquitin-protein ligase [Apostasia shenzhenica]